MRVGLGFLRIFFMAVYAEDGRWSVGFGGGLRGSSEVR